MKQTTTTIEQAENNVLNRIPGNPTNNSKHILAALIGPMPIFLLGIIMHLTKEGPYSVFEMLFYPLVIGSGGILWISFISQRLIGESIKKLNLKASSWIFDILTGLFLTPVLFLVFYISRFTIYRWLPSVNQDGMHLIRALAEDPLLLAVWLGPTVWIGIALFEEVSRCFILKRLWSAWDSMPAKWMAVVGIALLFGVMHLYQGPAGIVSIAVISLLKGIYYLYFGRIWPLIIAHALFDSFQIIWVVIMISQ